MTKAITQRKRSEKKNSQLDDNYNANSNGRGQVQYIESSLHEQSNMTSPEKRYIDTAKMSLSGQTQDVYEVKYEQTFSYDDKASTFCPLQSIQQSKTKENVNSNNTSKMADKHNLNLNLRQSATANQRQRNSSQF